MGQSDFFRGNLYCTALHSGGLLFALCLFDCAAYLSSDLDGIRCLCKSEERERRRGKKNFLGLSNKKKLATAQNITSNTRPSSS